MNNQSNTGSPGFKFTKPSLTIPGQVLTLRKILTRFRNGQGAQVYEGVYNPDVPPGIEKMDALDRADAAREMRAKVDSMRTRLARQEEEKAVSPTKTVADATEDKKNPED